MSFRFKRSKEPSALRTWRAANQPVQERGWEELPRDVKDAMRARRHRDQSGLCCYCYARIEPDVESHLEHIEPRNDDNRFDWDNLALACEGGNRSGNPPHCDHSKRQRVLALVHPHRSPVVEFVRLRSRGELRIHDHRAANDVNEVLNLNSHHLQRLRARALQAATADLTPGRRNRKSWHPRRLEQALNDLRHRADLLDYQPLIQQWLERRLHQQS